MNQPLNPFPNAAHTTAALNLHTLPFLAALSSGAIVTWILYAVFAFWAIYTAVAIYHWLAYSNASNLAFPAIATHLVVSFALMSYALSGSAFFLSYILP